MVMYTKRSSRWKMPSRYYTETMPSTYGQKVQFFFLDTCSLVCAGGLDFRCEDAIVKKVVTLATTDLTLCRCLPRSAVSSFSGLKSHLLILLERIGA